MADAAALSLTVDSSSVVKAANDLDKFTAASERAGKAGVGIGNQSGSIAKLVASVESANAKLSTIVGLLEKTASATKAVSASNDNTARSYANADSHVIAYTQHLAALARTQQDANAHVLAYQANLASSGPTLQQADGHVQNYRKSLVEVEEGARKASTAIKFTAQDSLNASRQLADIGVTAASGMSPFLIAIQQGPQLLDILQNKAAVTGQTLGAVFRAAAASILAAAAPFLPLIALLALVAAGIAAITKQANDDSGLKKYTTAMGYTKEEVKKLNAVTVTFGDTAKAVFQGALAGAASAMGTNTKGMAKTWDSFLDHLVAGTRAALAGVYAAIAGTKAYLGEVEKGGVLGIGKMLIGQGDPDLIKKTYGKAYAEAQKGMDAIAAQARKNAQKRQDTMAKGFYDKPHVPKGPKTDAEKLADIVRDAQAQIKVEQDRERAVGMAARAAEEMQQRTELLNRITKAGIPITAAVTTEVNKLAKAYADAKVAADIAGVMQGVTDDVEKQRSAVEDQTKLIGLYGDALARATLEMQAQQKLRDSLPRGEVVVMPNITGEVSDGVEANARLQRAADLKKASADAAYAMDLERKGLGLTGEAAIAYDYAVQRLNDAKRAGIALSPDEIAGINKAGDAYAAQRFAIDQQAKSIADARDVAKGFFSDWIAGIREGGNMAKTFADTVVSSLNRIVDKLLDKALDSFLDNMFKSGNSNFLTSLFGGKPAAPNALGGVYGAPERFANGGAFTNTIVNTPTLFRFANGGALGEMGEAGPEAIIPLKRGANGALGVQMHGGGAPSVRMGDIHNTYSLAGAVSPEGLMAAIRQGGEATVVQVKRELQAMLAELDAGGAFAK